MEENNEQKNNTSLEKIKLRNELLRFFFGTFLIAVITLGFNALLKHWEYQSESKKMRYDTYEKYLDRFDITEDRIDKIVLARTLSYIAPDKELKNGYQEMYLFLERTYGKENELEKSKIAKEVEQNVMKDNFILQKPDVIEEFASVVKDLEKEEITQEEKVQAKKRLNEIVTSNPELNQIVNLDNEIKETENMIENVRKESTIPSKNDNDKKQNYLTKNGWFKEGYMVTYDNVRIICDGLDTKNKVAEIRLQEYSNDKFDNVSSFKIKEGEIKEISNGKYIFNFIRIGKAGKNPFNKAVYFDFKIKNN